MAGARGRGRGRGGGPRSVSQQYLQNSANEAGLDIKNVGRSAAVGIFPDLELHSNGERRLLEHESDLLKEKRNGGKSVGYSGSSTEVAATAAADEDNTSTSLTTTQSTDDTSSSNRPKSPKTIYLISKSREMHHKFQNSVFYIRGSTKEVPDVERYSDRKRPPSNIDASDVLSHCLGGKKRTRGVGGGVFVPEELCGGQRRSIAKDIHDGEEGTTKKIKGGLTIAELAAKEGGMDNNEDDQKPSGAGDDEDVIGDDMPVEDEEDSDGADYTQNYYESDNSGGGSDGEPTY